ncbi:MAG TPA: GAF domain-containing protein, partial [Polyangiales bacterium]|nr:GAF domain-containing protein [Polyangiales bacterium]
EAAQEVSRRLIRGESGEELVEHMSAMQAKQMRTADILQRATGVDQRELSAAFTAVSEAERSGARIQLLFSLGCFALVLGLSLWLSRGLLRTVSALSVGFERFGTGMLREPITVQSRDELGMLAERANEMALSLARLQEERDRVDWIRTGQARLMNELQGDLTPAALARRALLFLVEYLQLPAAALYRVGAHGVLQPLSYCGRAQPPAGSAPQLIHPDEGLIGRAAAQTELMLIEDVPAGYLNIGSGLGAAPPSALVLMPLVHAGKVTGVLELACWKAWTPLQGELLTTMRESLSVAIEVAAAQEELRQANDGLRQQALELEQKNIQLDEARRGQ